jgi:hypothetical protein
VFAVVDMALGLCELYGGKEKIVGGKSVALKLSLLTNIRMQLFLPLETFSMSFSL